MEKTQGVVGSAETGSPSRGTLASLREASTSPTQRSKVPPFLGLRDAVSDTECSYELSVISL